MENIAEILNYAPKGLKLYSPIFGEVKFEKIDEDICIQVRDKYNNLRWFYEYGTFFPSDENNFSEGERLLFPCTSWRTWDRWQNILFPNSVGSVCVHTLTNNKFILGKYGTFFSDGTGCQFSTLTDEDGGNYLLNSVYASPSQAKEFFDELEKNGYEWDGETVVKKEQNNPKFHEGDWVVYMGTTAKILDLQKHCYVGKDVNDKDFVVSYCNECEMKKWTIQDANDGDVLASAKSVFIYQEEYIAEKPIAYCGIMNGHFVKGEDACWTNEKCYPATKEQRELLFKKMKEDGYEWDDDMKTLNEIQNEPIFNEGDFVVSKITNSTYQIESTVLNVTNNKYGYDLTNGGYIASNETHKYHLWTIDDAKDGDILISQRNKPFIYNGNYNDKFVGAHCGLNFDGEFKLECGKCIWTDNKNIHPANKEQCDLLFQKMKEKGYEWNSEKKELKKIGTPQPKFKVWELDGKANLSLEDKVAVLMDEILALKERVKALEIQVIKQCSDKNRLDSLESKMIILDSHNINNRLDALESRVFPIPEICKCPDKAGDNVTLKDMK